MQCAPKSLEFLHMQRTGFCAQTIFERISRRQKTPILIGIQLRATSTQKACRFRQNELATP